MRRNWKRILSLLLTVAMVFTMNTSVFAGTYKVTEGEGEAATTKYVNAQGTEIEAPENTEGVKDYSAEMALADVKATVKDAKSADDLPADEKAVWEAFAAKNADKAANLLAGNDEDYVAPTTELTADPVEKTTIYKLVKGEETTYYLADGSAVTYNDETKDQYEVSETTADALEGVRSLKFYTDGDNNKVFYEVKEDKNVKVEDATALEQALATETDQVSFEAAGDDPNGNVNGNAYDPGKGSHPIGWEIVDWEGKTVDTTQSDFYYDNDTEPYVLHISADHINKGRFLHPMDGAKEVQIEAMDAENAKTTISICGVNGKAVKIKTKDNKTTITVSGDAGTRVIAYDKSSKDWLDLTTAAATYKGTGIALGSGLDLSTSSFEYYVVNPAYVAGIAKVSENSTAEGTTGSEFAKGNYVKFSNVDAVFNPYTGNGFAADDYVLDASNKAIHTIKGGTEAGNGTGTDGAPKTVFALKKDGNNVNVYKQVVVQLSANHISSKDLGKNEVCLGISENETTDKAMTISMDAAKTNEGKYGKNTLEVALLSGNFSAASGWWKYQPESKYAEKGKSDQKFPVEGLEGNKVYFPAVRTVSAADADYVADEVLYVPSKWIKTSSGLKTKPTAGALTFENTVFNIGKSSASINVAATSGTGTGNIFQLGGIYVAEASSSDDLTGRPTVSSDGDASRWHLVKKDWQDKVYPGNAVTDESGSYTFNLSANILQPGKLYNVYAMGELNDSAPTNLDSTKLVFGSKPIATFATVASDGYELTYGLKDTYKGENVKIDGNKVTMGARYAANSTGYADNALANLEIKSFKMKTLSTNGQAIEIDKSSIESILGSDGKDSNNVDKNVLKRYMVGEKVANQSTYAGVLTSLDTFTSWSMVKASDPQVKLDMTASLDGNQKYSISAADINKSITLTVSMCEQGHKFGVPLTTVNGLEATAATLDLTVVPSKIYVYPAFKSTDSSNPTTVSDGKISTNSIRYSFGVAADTKALTTQQMKEDYMAAAGELASFRLENAAGKEVTTLNAKTKFPITVTPGKYKLQLKDVKSIEVPNNIDGFELAVAPKKEYKGGPFNTSETNDTSIMYPFVTITSALTGDETLELSLAKSTAYPVFFATLSANDGKEEYLTKAFVPTLHVKGDTTNKYEKFDKVYVKVTSDKSEAEGVVKSISSNRMSMFNSMSHEVELNTLPAGNKKYYAIMMIKCGDGADKRTVYDLYGWQAGYVEFSVEKRPLTLSWDGGTDKKVKNGAAGAEIIDKVGRGTAGYLSKDIEITADDYSLFKFYPMDASGNAITKDTKGTADVNKTGFKVASTGEVIDTAMFVNYGGKKTEKYLIATNGVDTSNKKTAANKINKSNVSIATANTNGYEVTLVNTPALISKSQDASIPAFASNFDLKKQNIKIVVNTRTTVTFKSAFGGNTFTSQTFELDESKISGTTTVGNAEFTSADKSAGDAVRNTFKRSCTTAAAKEKDKKFTSTLSACIIPTDKVGNRMGYGEVTGFTIQNGAVWKVDELTDIVDVRSALINTYIEKDHDYIITADIKAHITDGWVEIETGEQNLTVTTVPNVYYDGRSHVINDEDLKGNHTSKENDITLTITDTKKGGANNLTLNKDFTIKYQNNKEANVRKDENGNLVPATGKNVKQPVMIITGKGDYKGLDLKINFNIIAADIGTAYIENVSEYIQSKNDSKGNKLDPRVKVTRTFQKKENPYEEIEKTVTLGKNDFDAFVTDLQTNTKYPIASSKDVVKAPSDGSDYAQYQITLVGKGNYSGEMAYATTIKVFGKNSNKLLNNSKKINWTDKVKKNQLSYTNGDVKIEDLVTSVMIKNNNVEYKTKSGGTKYYKLKVEEKNGNKWEEVSDDYEGNNGTYHFEDGNKVMTYSRTWYPGEYRLTLVGNGDNVADAADKIFGETKPQTFKVQPAKTGWANKDQVSFKTTKFGSDTADVAFTSKTTKLPYSGADTLVEVTRVGSLNPTKWAVEHDTNDQTQGLTKAQKLIEAVPHTETIKVLGRQEFLGKKLEFKVTRQPADLKDVITGVKVETLSQNINGAIPADYEFYLTMLGEKVGKRMQGAGAGTSRWDYVPNYSKNTAVLYFEHKLSENATYKGQTFKGVLQLKFSGNDKAGINKAKVTVTGLKDVRMDDINNGNKASSYIIGGGLKAQEYSINTADITANKLHRYNAIDTKPVAGEFYYTVEDVKEAKSYKPKFTLYQATNNLAGTPVVTNKVIRTSEYAFTGEKEWTVSSDKVSVYNSLVTNSKAKNYTVNKGKTGDARLIKIDGVYIYQQAAKLNVKDGLVLNERDIVKKPETGRWIYRDSKNALVYDYNGLYVNLAESIQQMTLKAGKEELTLDGTADASKSDANKVGLKNGTVTDVSQAIEILSITPSNKPLNQGNYTATVRIRPNIAHGKETKPVVEGRLGGTVKISFKINKMAQSGL